MSAINIEYKIINTLLCQSQPHINLKTSPLKKAVIAPKRSPKFVGIYSVALNSLFTLWTKLSDGYNTLSDQSSQYLL